ncbi:DUF262 domain-containing protein [Nonlabens sp. Asnod3-H03]|uniref:DUF262 domain-containing protein n=1 Tax=Nonlabens sp. Asnod3-H03 TaxID=3160580 RepID=UPI003864B285
MKEETIALKPIEELIDMQFLVPSYQRGYRWTEKQVTDLLDDIYEFDKDKSKSSSEFYCLQPVVVSKQGQEYVLIDGQQRLTTIFLILKFLTPIREILGIGSFEIDYETRENSRDFLENLDKSLKDDNIDFFHMAAALDTIEEWFDNKSKTAKADFLQVLLRPKEEENVRVIWYEIEGEESDLIDVFTRINIGKIPLTNAELIKALILSEQANVLPKSDQATRIRQLEIANDWDRIEQSLRNEELWYFIQDNANSYDNRIEFIFDLIADNKSSDPYHTFRYFNLRIKNNEPVVEVWSEIKNLYMKIIEWYSNREYFHLIGYLIATGFNLKDILKWSEGVKKSKFRSKLKQVIMDHIQVDGIANLTYLDDPKVLRDTLLLFNIASIIQSENSSLRFQFNKYKGLNWDIEHIHSVTTEKPERKNHQEDWLKELIKYSKIEEIKVKVENYFETKPSERVFDDLYNDVLKEYSVDKQITDIDDISNLALLDSGTNRGYKNAVFPIKRDKIIEKERKGVFIPLCTKNAFLKYYSRGVERMTFWEEEDRKAYKDSIITTIEEYLIA